MPVLSERVRRLIRFLHIRIPYEDESNYPESYNLTLGNMADLLEALPCLDDLHLHGIQLNTAYGAPGCSDFRRPLKSLHFQDVRSSSVAYPPLKEIATFMTLFPTIDSLTLYFSHIRDSRGPNIADDISLICQDLHGPSSTCIQDVYIHGESTLLHLLYPMSFADNLRSLEIHHHYDIVKAFEEMLKDRPSRLNTLKIQFSLEPEFSSYGFEPFITGADADLVEANYHWTIDAPSVPCLKSLELVYMHMWWNYKGTLVVWNRMVRLLQHFSSIPLESLGIQLFCMTAGADSQIKALETLRRLPWDDLNLALQRYTTLNKPITVTIQAYLSRPEALRIMEIVVERLSSLELRSRQAGKPRRARLAWVHFDGSSEETHEWEDMKADAGGQV
ncbi:hypothetical protein EIP86_007221 [Pleurotus ostreatoroseus]|nr:hypothetical protein EIP86_007221 [Pleurotus ostreatoroseus]